MNNLIFNEIASHVVLQKHSATLKESTKIIATEYDIYAHNNVTEDGICLSPKVDNFASFLLYSCILASARDEGTAERSLLNTSLRLTWRGRAATVNWTHKLRSPCTVSKKQTSDFPS